MQPAYLPWAGYFNLMSQADVFVYLDDAQLVRPSWHNRNRILRGGKPAWLTIAIAHADAPRSINEARFDDSHPWRTRQVAAVRTAYERAPFGADAIALIERVLGAEASTLADLDIALIEHAAGRLGLGAKRVRASTLGIEAKRSGRLVEICRAFAADEYLSPVGSRDYLEADGFAAQNGIVLRYQEFSPGPYPQGAGFVSHLSIVDVVAQLGWSAAASYVRSGRLEAEHRGPDT